MIKKERKLVITFVTTVDAMMMEQVCKEEGAAGRLIPVPGFISAGCGLAWCADPETEEALRNLIERKRITVQEMQVCLV